MAIEQRDVLIVGAGFAGLYQLDKLRKIGYDVHAVESAGGLGGVWYWNCYPGARVDTWGPMYQFSDEELWRDWNFSELYPDWSEVRAYFKHVDEKLNLSKDISFNTQVTGAEFNEDAKRWLVHTENTETGEHKDISARYFLLCTGFGSKPYIPEIPGLETFKGECYHTARWPQEGVDLAGKRIAVIGTGASGVQVAQESAPVAEALTVFQRTPMIALPMRQRKLTDEENAKDKETYPERMAQRNHHFAGFDFDFLDKGAADVTPEEREAEFQRLWDIGGFVPWLGNFNDLLFNEDSNRAFYRFWRDETRKRITREDLWEDLAPTEPPHPFGVKRPSLEQNYFEIYSQDNVSLVNLRNNPIDHVTTKGIVTADGVEHEFDLIVLATGFDAVTGGITQIDIRNAEGESFADSFRDGAHTALGAATAGFPNLMFVYGPQSPSAFCNGPTNAEAQGEWVVNFLDHLMKNDIQRVEATREAEQVWQQKIDEVCEMALFDRAASWYMAANIPGKKVQMLMWPAGLPAFLEEVNTSAANGYPEFVKA
ncbi:cyclohexanone monooxygenase [Rhodococcus aetherivorans]|uniref:Cyclohexanone monooxygenase n=1 Tax=Rhodococcus aetherivorans TaxID=191292 RepID=A0ABQ0YHH6_9NOCA|nr:NAD(P)/FAD-dependent oxidoreductase [Rhodococcus aetherivorans]ETT25288.1 Cyclopentanone monooxygenase [Rhodococcus rhodochrous ATCC 21198]NGP29671.1 NAD(P)/FAD-dependent oxidoreductase [Rhodococcus aetherivorans]GES36006.1 cyclohexanone monooxygenase [Rhodococcus aetherivorans]